MSELHNPGWLRFPADPAIYDWARCALPHARAAVADPANARWLRCGGTWFAGVNVLRNAADGTIGGSGPLRGAAVEAIRGLLGDLPPFDAGQISVIYPGYPVQDKESDAAHTYRLRRDSAHVDGLLRIGAENRRMIREPHAFVLGIPLTDSDEGASPLVVWEGSQEVMRKAFRTVLANHPADKWSEVDVTEVYKAARRTCFETCRRVAIHASPGEAYLIHRLALHGVSPWQDGAGAGPDGRMIAYFRPALTSLEEWLGLD